MKDISIKFGLLIFLLLSGFQFYRIGLQGMAEFQFKPVIEEIPKAYSLDLDEVQDSIANISKGELWLEVLNRIRLAIYLDPEQARYYRWLGLAFTARAVSVPAGSELQQNLLLEAKNAFLQAMRLNPVDPYIVEHVLSTKARLNDFGQETELLLKNMRTLAPRENQIYLQLLLEYLPRYSVLPPEIKIQIDDMYSYIISSDGSRNMFLILSYSNRLQACKPLNEDEPAGFLLRWPEHICNDIAVRSQNSKRLK